MTPTKGYKRDFYPIKVPVPKADTQFTHKKPNTLVLNMGPQHPSTHGVLRVVLELDGEKVVSAYPDIGYLHRGYEKIAENRTYYQYIPYTDRLDYLTAPGNNISYCMAVEKLLGIETPKRCQYLRVLIYELARIASHLVAIGTYSLDVGAATVFFHTWSEREEIYALYEMICGARLTTSLARVGGMMRDTTPEFIQGVRKFSNHFSKKIDEYEKLLSKNRIWLNRTKNVGVISKELALRYSLTGPVLRASGINWDLRKNMPYLAYSDFDFDVPLGENGDCYDRYLVRIQEMRESLKIVKQALENLPSGPLRVTDRPDIVIPSKKDVYTKMESLIYHFKIMSQGFNVPLGEVYFATESSKGELGWYIQSDGSSHPKRLRIHSPSFMNIQVLPEIVEGALFTDVITTIASLDPVMGEIDK
ncbi:MAG: NADH dehydrogenase (quinone) subunit D [Deltaproteobacteria bacterium]|nr:NADH dehydrogenase (quinone) subunit D [Deltaproteobacteria bacterium]